MFRRDRRDSADFENAILLLLLLALCTSLSAFFLCGGPPSAEYPKSHPASQSSLYISTNISALSKFSPDPDFENVAYSGSWVLRYANAGRYLGHGRRGRLLKLGLSSRSTYTNLLAYDCFTHNCSARVLSQVEIECMFLICGTPPHPGPTTKLLKVWCALCPSSHQPNNALTDNDKVDSDGYHIFKYAGKLPNTTRVKCVPRYVFQAPSNADHAIGGVSLLVSAKNGPGWFLTKPLKRVQPPEEVQKQLHLKGASTKYARMHIKPTPPSRIATTLIPHHMKFPIPHPPHKVTLQTLTLHTLT